MATHLAITAVALWFGLAAFGKEAPLGLWKCLFVLPTVLVMLALKALIFVGSFGTKAMKLYVEDK